MGPLQEVSFNKAGKNSVYLRHRYDWQPGMIIPMLITVILVLILTGGMEE